MIQVKSYSQMSMSELESALASLQDAARGPEDESLLSPTSTMAEWQHLSRELQACEIKLEMESRRRHETEERLETAITYSRALLAATPDLMFRLSRDGTYLDFRAERESDLVLPPQAIIGTKVEHAPLPPEVKEQSQRYIRLTLETGQPQSFEYSLSMVDGHRYYECRMACNGEDEVVSLVRDITPRKRIEEALRESEDRYRDLVEHSRDLLSIHDLEGRILSLNQGAAAQLGYDPSELVDKNLRDILVVETADQVNQYLEAIQRDGVAQGLMVVRTKTGEHRIWEYHNTLRTEGVTSPVVRGMAHDVTEAKRAERALRQAEEKYRAIFENAIEGIAQTSLEGRFITVNPALARMLGYASPKELLTQIYDLTQQVYVNPARRAEFIQEIAAQGMVQGFECELYRKDGSRMWVSMNARAIRDAQGRLLYYEGSTEDITARKQAEAQLREQAALLDHAQDAIMVRDLEGRVIYWNKSAERIYGWTTAEVIGRDVRELLYRGGTTNFDLAHRQLLERGEWSGEMHQFNKHGQELILESHWTLVRSEQGQPKSVLVINTDVTEKKKIETQFLRVQRLESIGTLAGGIAHDLNNVFAPILMSIKLLATKLPDEESQQLLNFLQGNTERGAHLVKQVISFARGRQGERTMLSPKHLIREMVKILSETSPKSMRIKSVVPEGLWAIHGDATQMHQVLMNLCVNARDAMPDGGELTITVENIHFDDAATQFHREAKPGPYIRLTVTDTGVGIPAEVIDKIFEPFFTTKGPGHGTGLGLSTALSLARSHGGFITVASSPGQGARFEVYLPAAEAAQILPSHTEAATAPGGQGQTILVIDDEVTIRRIAQSTLEAFGYRVLTASDGAEATALYAQYRERIDVVLADLVLPSMSGAAIIRELLKIDPQACIIASSGLLVSNKMEEALQAGAKQFLPKPFTADQLLEVLADVLHNASSEHDSASASSTGS